MLSEPSSNSNKKNISQPVELDKENIICKDGFCSLPSLNNKPKINKDNVNLFDPI